MAEWWENDPVAQQMQPQPVEWWKGDPETPDAAAAKPKAPEGWLDYANSVARAGANSLTAGHADELAGMVGSAGNKLLRAVGMDVPEQTYTDIREKEDQGIRDFRETNPVAAYGTEVGAGLAIPFGAGAKLLQGGLTLGKIGKGAATVGAPMGAAYGIGEARQIDDAGDAIGEAVKGGLLGAAGHAVGTPLAYGAGKGIQAIGKAVRYARKPQDAALEKTAQALMDDDIDPNALRGLVAPKGKEAAGNRGLSDVQVSEVIRRVRDGEDLTAIASGMVNPRTGKPFTPATLSRYVGEYADNTDVPMNLIDLAKSMPDAGGAASITNLGRAAASSRGKAQSTAATALVNRQQEQGGRMGEHLDRAAGGVHIEDEIARLESVVGEQSNAAYAAARANTKPFDLRGVVSKWRADARGNDPVSRQLNEALDSFFDPGMVEQVSAKQSPITFKTAKGSTYSVHGDGTTSRNKAFRPEHGPAEQGHQPRSQATFYVTPAEANVLGEIQAKGGNASRLVAPTGDGRYGIKYASGPNQGKFERRTLVSAQTEPGVGLIPVELWEGGKRVHFGNSIVEVGGGGPMPLDQLRHTKLMQPTSDMEQFMRSRRGLDQMIDASKQNGKPTTLTRALSGLRRDLNDAARKDNADWLTADTKFSEGKAGQAALEMGEKLALRSGGKQRQILAKFDKMGDEQKGLVRLGLIRQLQDRVINKGEGHDVTAQLSNDGMNRMILRVFPPKVGQRLIRDIKREGITTDTLREVFGGSRTAPLMDDMKQLGQDAALLGNLMTGNVGGSLREAASRIMRGLNERQSQEITTLLTNTRPEDLLPILDALGKAKDRLRAGEPVRNVLRHWGAFVGTQQTEPLVLGGQRQ
jgi:hypothetical protein